MTRKSNIVNDNSKANYDARNEVTYNAEVLKSKHFEQEVILESQQL